MCLRDPAWYQERRAHSTSKKLSIQLSANTAQRPHWSLPGRVRAAYRTEKQNQHCQGRLRRPVQEKPLESAPVASAFLCRGTNFPFPPQHLKVSLPTPLATVVRQLGQPQPHRGWLCPPRGHERLFQAFQC